MPARVLAILLALLLLGSALATHASSMFLAEPAHAQGLLPAPLDDDAPAQPQAETASDAQALPMQPVDRRGPAAAATGPWPWSTDARPAPFLDGLQRPPQGLLVTA